MTLPVTTDSLLHRLGWDDGWEAAFAEHRAAGLDPARVAVQHRGAYDLVAEDGEVRASAANRFVREDDLPAVGDWVGLDRTTGLIEALLPRRTSISRKEVWQATREQILAANVDVAFLVQALPLDFNVRRLERYLAMAWESGAQPVVLLTKTDLTDDVTPFLDDVEATTLGSCPVQAVSARTGEGIEELRSWFDGNRTAVLLGSSGVGKSTIVNALVGEELIATQEVRADDQMGRHTTTRRELILVPTGGVVLDTPGIRELQLWDADLEQTFGDVDEIARRCRFSDCNHDTEPGCAIREALADGSLPRERWDSYVKLQREQEALEARRNHLLRQERRREWKIREREARSNMKKKGR
ncbi:MAG TPA: ribosome small subunit-dependent GTPase A [Gaiellaceae bacterium]|nr:ribosome small subunit-dependent GTPase A [Gaiellaceae bacterium]